MVVVLPAPFRAEEGDYLAGLDAQVDPADGFDCPEALVDADEVDRRRGHASMVFPRCSQRIVQRVYGADHVAGSGTCLPASWP